MITFDKLWSTLAEKNKSRRYLRQYIGGGTYQNLKQNGNVSSYTLNIICKTLNCKLDEIAEYISDDEYDAL